jgi:hypothetical protein
MVAKVDLQRTKDDLLWLLNALSFNEFIMVYRAPVLIEQLFHFLQTNPKENLRISAWLDRALTEFALISELSRQMDLFQPWAMKRASRRDQDKNYDMKLTTEYLNANGTLGGVHAQLRKGTVSGECQEPP